ncbi:hypothetical protein C8R43DRAFT_878856 [Mycena crocata]|nr:hypothetical protein C8R43DRAFT_878856 [Mycena crocata]
MGTGKKNTKASALVAALNIRGNGSTNVYNPKNKWYEIWRIMWERRIGVLIVGEAHLDDNRKADLDSLYGKCLHLEFSKDPETPNAKGIAFVLNRNFVLTSDITTREIVPGRAMLLEMQNVDGKPLSILGVYAPNQPGENEKFWNDIKTYFIANPGVRRPDLMGGDTNIVESEADRCPMHPDNAAAVEALDNLKTFLRLVDGWRETYPTTLAYTYHQALALGGAQSRIDRIYVKRDLYEQTFEWGMQSVGIETDHRMVTMRMTTADTPTLRHGRWKWPAHIIRDKELKEYRHKEGMILERDLEAARRLSTRDPDFNAQTLWASFKTRIGNKARARAKIVVPKMKMDIDDLEEKLKEIRADENISEEERKLAGAMLLESIVVLEKERHEAARLTAKVRNFVEGEVIGKYWSMLNNPANRERLYTDCGKKQAQTEDRNTR